MSQRNLRCELRVDLVRLVLHHGDRVLQLALTLTSRAAVQHGDNPDGEQGFMPIELIARGLT